MEHGSKQSGSEEDSSALELMLFGTFEARADGASLTRLLSAKGRLLLAFLALNSGRPVATGVIAEAVFPDSQAEDPHEIVKKTVQEIRRVLGQEAYRLSTPAPRMLTLDLEGATVDWNIFHAALQAGLQTGSVESLQHAVAIHSRPLLESETLPWAIAEQTRCLELRHTALEVVFRQAMDKEDAVGAAQALAQQLAFEAPFLTLKEAHWRELFQMLLRRQEFGLLHHHYVHLKTFLEHTAGRMPEQATQALYQHIPRAVLLQITQRRERKGKSALPASVRLPNFPFALLGREQEKRELTGALANSRLVTIVGIGGVGKTRLAVHAAQEAVGAHGEAGFLDLTPCTESDLLQTVASALDVKESAGTPLYRSLSEFLGSKPLLLVLDNCEHVIEATAALCADLLRDCPCLRLLATSRETLRVDGEQVFPCKPFVVPTSLPATLETCAQSAAIRLFVERAVAVQPEFQLDWQNAPVIIELCRLVDGLPLGIEMIASQVTGLPLEGIAADLTDCILNLKHRKRGVVPRHRTLVAALDWSYGILSKPEQTLLRRLAVFTGGWTLAAAEQVCSDDTLPRNVISSALFDLVSKSLVTTATSDHNTLRFDFLETVRVYAGEHLRLAVERERFQARHLDYFVSLAEEAERQMSGKNQKAWLERVDSDYANCRSSLRQSVETNIASGLRLGYGLSRYWEVRGYFGEGRDWCSALLAQTEPTDRSVPRARLVDIAGWFANILNDYEKAQVLLQESLGIFREQGDEVGVSITLIRLGLVAINLGDNERARALFEESLALRRQMGDKRLGAVALMNLGIVVSSLGDYSLARSLHEECLSLLKEVGDRRMLASCLSSLGELAARLLDYPRAHALMQESLTILQDLGDKYLLRFGLRNLGGIAFCLENFEEAFASYAKCLELSWEAKIPFHLICSLEGLANLALKQQQWERGVTLWGAAEAFRNPLNYGLDAWEQQLHDHLIPLALEAMGKAAFDRAWETGRLLSQEAAVALALGSA